MKFILSILTLFLCLGVSHSQDLQSDDNYIIEKISRAISTSYWKEAPAKYTDSKKFLKRYKTADADLELGQFLSDELSGLEGNNRYITPKEFQQNQNFYSKQILSMGIGFAQEGPAGLINYVQRNMPAWSAGIRPGDTIISVNDVVIDALERSEIREHFLFETPGQRTLKILTSSGETNTVSVDAAFSKSPGYFETSDNILYWQPEKFDFDVVNNFREHLIELESETGATAKGIILDLRWNTGGLLNTVKDISDLFIKDGLVFSIDGRKNNREFLTTKSTVFDGPLIVLTNNQTNAGAAMVARILQIENRALFIGENSGTDQTQFVKSIIPINFDGGALLLTTHTISMADGKFIPEDGVKVDIEWPTQFQAETDPAKDKAITILNSGDYCTIKPLLCN